MAAALPPDVRRETRAILALAWPVVLTSLNWNILQVTDVVVVGLVSTTEAAALGAARSVGFVTLVGGLAWLSGILVTAARADGAGDAAARAGVLRDGLALAVVLGLAIGVVMFAFATPLLAGLGVAPTLVGPGAAVTRMFAVATPFQLVLIAASFFLEGVSRPGRVAAVNIAVLPVNGVLAWALAGGHLGLPMLGAVGAAMATAIASALGAALMIAAALRLPQARGGRALPRAAGSWALARFGLVPAIASALELAGFSILIALSTQLGTATAHAFQIVFAVHNLTFALALGFGSAAGVRVGNAVGEGRPDAARGRTGIALVLTVATMGAVALGIAAAAAPVVAAFPASAAVHALALQMLPLWVPFLVFDGIQVVLVYALRSLGDQVIAGVNSMLAYFVVTGGVGWWLVDAGVGPLALVWASAVGMVAAALLHGARFVQLGKAQV